MKNISLKQEGGGYRVIKVEGCEGTWQKITGDFIYDFQFEGVKADLKKDRVKITIL